MFFPDLPSPFGQPLSFWVSYVEQGPFLQGLCSAGLSGEGAERSQGTAPPGRALPWEESVRLWLRLAVNMFCHTKPFLFFFSQKLKTLDFSLK